MRAEGDVIDRQLERIVRTMEIGAGFATGLAWARTAALSDLVSDMFTGDRDDAGVAVLQRQLQLAAIVTRNSSSLEVAAAHHDRLAADLDAVRPGQDSFSELGNAVLAHRIAAEICRGDFVRLRSFASRRKDGKDYTAALRLPPV